MRPETFENMLRTLRDLGEQIRDFTHENLLSSLGGFFGRPVYEEDIFKLKSKILKIRNMTNLFIDILDEHHRHMKNL